MRGLATRCSCPPVSLKGVTVCAWGVGGPLCVLRAEKQSELLAGNSGHRGQGPAGDCPPKAHQPTASGGAAAGRPRER